MWTGNVLCAEPGLECHIPVLVPVSARELVIRALGPFWIVSTRKINYLLIISDSLYWLSVFNTLGIALGRVFFLSEEYAKLFSTLSWEFWIVSLCFAQCNNLCFPVATRSSGCASLCAVSLPLFQTNNYLRFAEISTNQTAFTPSIRWKVVAVTFCWIIELRGHKQQMQ